MPWRSILSETGGTAEYNLVMLQSHLPLAQSQRPGDARKKKKREWERHNEIYTDQSHGRVGSQFCQYIWSMSTVDISTRFEKARVDSYRKSAGP